MSLIEEKFSKVIKKLIPQRHKWIKNYRPHWLKNEATGRNLEIDFFFPTLGIGFEIQGNQHFFDGAIYGHNIDYQQKNDNLKYELIKKKNKQKYMRDIVLVEVFEEDLKGTSLKEIANKLSQRALKCKAVELSRNIERKCIENGMF